MTEQTTNVLLVEDNPGDARLIRELLAHAKVSRFSLECVDRLAPALDRIAEGGIELVLLDLALPDGQGLDTFVRLRAGAPEMPVVIMTGLNDEELAVRAVREGAQDYLVKGNVDCRLLERSIRYAMERQRAEGALRESEEKYRRLIENLPESYFFYRHGTDRVFTYLSTSVKKVLGYSVEELLSDYAEQFTDNPINEEAIRHAELGLRGVRQPPYELEIYHKDGSVRMLDIQEMPVYAEDGTVVALEGIARDITEHKRIHARLVSTAKAVSAAAGESFFEDLLLHVASTLDADFAFVGELIGDNEDRVHTIAAWGAGEIIENFEYALECTPCAEVLEHGARIYPTGIQELYPDDHLLKKMHIEGYVGAPLCDPRGRVTGIMVALFKKPIQGHNHLACLIDILATRAAAEVERTRVEQVTRLLAACLHAAASAVVVTDRSGIIRWANPAFTQLTGYSLDEAVGQTLRILSSGKHDKAFYQRIWETILAGQVWHGELINRRKDGSFYTEEQTITPVFDDRSNTTHFISIKQDITDRKWAEKEIRALNADLEHRVAQRTVKLELANKQLEAFAYSVSHDLKGPLRAIAGFTGMLQGDYADRLDDEGRHRLDQILASTEHMTQLIDGLMTLSTAGRKELRPRAVDTGELVRTVFEELGAAGAGRRIEQRLNSLPPIHGDPSLIRQVFTNLLSNAIKSTRDKDPAIIEVGCRANGDEDIHSVTDNGIGFDMAYSDKLFKPFQRLHYADEFPGTGVGLAIVQHIIERHGGRIWAESTVGLGATFYFALPRHPSTDQGDLQ